MSAPALPLAEADEHSPDGVLARVFGFPAFRGQQGAAVRHVAEGGDALVLMPTGGGKSICYQVPALCRRGLALVISPLIALMDDQVAALRQLGVAAGALHSELDPDENERLREDLSSGRLKILYVSPERLLAGTLIERLAQRRIALVAIDEAHCVSQWGHEFRPDYRLLDCLPDRFPGVPRVALTATADARTRADIAKVLRLEDATVFAASFHRPNLHVAARAKSAERAQLRAFLDTRPGQTGIVYCGSRKKAEQMAAFLVTDRFPAIAYHAKLDPGTKRRALQKFRSGEPLIVVATIAFGMGIDRPDVRFVAHLDMPDSPEAFYQQIGRAGRDGLRADTLLLYGADDILRARHWLEQSPAGPDQKRVMEQRLEAMIGLCESGECRTQKLLACFGEVLPEPCGHCDRCATPLTAVDATVAAQKVLSAVYRTGQRFGAGHIVNVLRGEESPMTARHNHQALPTWGAGRDQPETYWRGVLRQLVARGFLRRADGEYATLSLDAVRARPVLRGEEAVLLHQDTDEVLVRRPRRGAPAAGAALAADDPVFEALRAWRTAEARAQSVPPYVIFHDSVLRDIAQARPLDRDALASIKGVGTSKLDRYGPRVLGVVAEAAA